MNRKLLITLDSNWEHSLKQAARIAQNGMKKNRYQGEILNFVNAQDFFSKLSEKKWQIIHQMINNKVYGVRELARQMKRDVKRVHEDLKVLEELGIIEKNEDGSIFCPYTEIHIDMHIQQAA